MSKPNFLDVGVDQTSTVDVVGKSEKNRYSDHELEEFKRIILKKLEKARSDYEMYRGSNLSENGTDDTSPTFKFIEDGAHSQSNEINDHLAKRQICFISQLEAALVRIENKTYGICRETGKLISKERLQAVPHTSLSVDGKSFAKRRN